MEIFQIIIIIGAIFALSRAILRFKSKTITFGEVSFWSIIWIGVIVIGLIPSIMNRFAQLTGIRRPIDLLIYGSITLLFYLIFRLYVKIENLNQDITKIVRDRAIKKRK